SIQIDQRIVGEGIIRKEHATRLERLPHLLEQQGAVLNMMNSVSRVDEVIRAAGHVQILRTRYNALQVNTVSSAQPQRRLHHPWRDIQGRHVGALKREVDRRLSQPGTDVQ